ncbi:MAG: TonB-dependent receptor, partial [Elusimicrobia bacterium]|nr:TonB-dependent receptor [Elusimicrobiota bacterium]
GTDWRMVYGLNNKLGKCRIPIDTMPSLESEMKSEEKVVYPDRAGTGLFGGRKILIGLCIAVLFILGIGFEVPANAEPVMDEELLFMEIPVVITPSMTQQTIMESPNAVTVITERDIKLNGWQSLPEVYRSVVGFTDFQDDSQEVFPIHRGVYTHSYIWGKVMINGHSVNLGFCNGIRCVHDFNISNVKQIEIVRGPGSSLYGAQAVMYIINIITKDEKEFKINNTIGENDYQRRYFSYGTDINDDLSISMFGENFTYKGPDIIYEKGMLQGTQWDFAKKWNRDEIQKFIYSRIKYKDLKLSVGYGNRQINWLQGWGGINTEDPFSEYASVFLSEFEYNKQLTDTLTMKILSGIDYAVIKYFGQYLPFGYTDGTSTWPYGAYFSNDATVMKNINDVIFNYTIQEHKLLIGLSNTSRQIVNPHAKGNIDTVTRVAIDEGIVEFPNSKNWTEEGAENTYAAFIQDIYTITNSLSLIAGARYDDYKTGYAEKVRRNAVSPRIALINEFSSNFVGKVNYSEAFASPALWYQFVDFGTSAYSNNPDVEQEKLRHIEISFSNADIKRFWYNLVFFRYTLYDIIGNVADPNRPTVFIGDSIGDVNGSGVELETKYKPTSDLSFFMNYAFTEAKFKDTDVTFKYSSDHIANGGFTWNFLKKFYLTPRLFVISKRHKNTFINAAKGLDGYMVMDANLLYEFSKDFEAAVTVRNALDEDYVTGTDWPNTSNLPANPRETRLSLTAKF